jgi:phosphatidylserine/phosphatidylglycerophosphate/cardiolipin synthase-like enzyme
MIAFMISLILSSTIWARIYPERSNTELFYVTDETIDFEVRMKLIKEANFSIDIISFSQAPDSIGKPFLNTIREVQKSKCIKVRFLYDSILSMIDRDFTNESAKLLTEKSLKCPAQIIRFSIFEKWKANLSWDDFFHEKVLIIDAGTSHEVVITGGRGYTRFSSIVLDSALILRSINSREPSLTTDIKESFNDIWLLAKKLSPIIEREASYLEEQIQPLELIQTPEQKKVILEMLMLLNMTPNKNEKLKSYQYRPESIQLISNDLIKSLVAKNSPILKDRELFKNMALKKMIEDINQFTGTIEMTSYSIAMPSELSEALVHFINRGNRVNFYTNGLDAHRLFFPFGIPIFYTAEGLSSFIINAKNPKGKIHIYFLDSEKARKHKALTYLHRKTMLFLNSTKSFVYTGSDNFTWSSAYKNDEWLIKIKDHKMAHDLAEKSLQEKAWYREISQEEIIKLNQERSWLYFFFRPFIRNNY